MQGRIAHDASSCIQLYRCALVFWKGYIVFVFLFFYRLFSRTAEFKYLSKLGNLQLLVSKCISYHGSIEEHVLFFELCIYLWTLLKKGWLITPNSHSIQMGATGTQLLWKFPQLLRLQGELLPTYVNIHKASQTQGGRRLSPHLGGKIHLERSADWTNEKPLSLSPLQGGPPPPKQAWLSAPKMLFLLTALYISLLSMNWHHRKAASFLTHGNH